MGCPGYGPCSWSELIDLSCCLVSGAYLDPCLLDGDPVSQTIIDNAKLVASQVLWAATGRQFSQCSVTLRPCRQCDDECCVPSFDNYTSDGYGSFGYYPFHQADGTWINKSCGCQDNCSCTNLSEVMLPYPTCSIDEVKVDGVVLSADEYVVLNFERLVLTPTVTGITEWPRCNNLLKPDTEVGTWSVTLTYGRPVPELVLQGASEMACQLIKSCMNKPCQLPQRISSVTRQGVSISFLDSMDFLDKGRTGLYWVDLAIQMYNPRGLARRPTVYSPDVKGKWAVTTWQAGDPVGPIDDGNIDGGGPTGPIGDGNIDGGGS